MAGPNAADLVVIDPSETQIRTVIVVGSGRSGTSLLAGCMRLAGVCMGEDVHPVKHEWSPITYSNGTIDGTATRNQIRRMNATYNLWGWKSPRDFYTIGHFLHYLRLPALLVITRDPSDVANSAQQREMLPLKIGLYETAMVYSHIFDRMRFLPIPKVIIPYGKLQRDAAGYTVAVCRLLGQPVEEGTLDKIRAFSNRSVKGDYRSIDGHSIEISSEELMQDAESTSATVLESNLNEYQNHATVLLKEVREACSLVAARLNDGSSQVEIVIEQLSNPQNERRSFTDKGLSVTLASKLLETTLARAEDCSKRISTAAAEYFTAASVKAQQRYEILRLIEIKYLEMMRFRLRLQACIDPL